MVKMRKLFIDSQNIHVASEKRPATAVAGEVRQRFLPPPDAAGGRFNDVDAQTFNKRLLH
jgi:hypothetical protein